MKRLSRIKQLGLKTAIGAILVLGATAGAAWSAPLSYVVVPGSGTIAIGDTVTVTFTFDINQLVYPPEAEVLEYGAGVYYDDRYFAFVSRGGSWQTDVGDWVYMDAGTYRRHEAASTFYYEDRPAFRDGFTYWETFVAIGGTPEGLVTGFQPAAAMSYRVQGVSRTLINVGAFEYFDVTPHDVPEPVSLWLLGVAVTGIGVRRWHRARASAQWN